MRKTTILTLMIAAALIIGEFSLSTQLRPKEYRASATTPVVYVYVNETIYANVSSSLTQYKNDLAAEGYNVTIVNSTQSSTASGIRENLRNDANTVGVLFVGHNPVVWCDPNNRYDITFSSDYYFMDLDGNWSDWDQDGMFDHHSNGTGDMQPEIWCGRIHGWDANEVTMINNYFTKVHNLRTGKIVLPQIALRYVDDPWSKQEDTIHRLSEVAGEYFTVTEIYDNATTKKSDYTTRLNYGYELVAPLVHSTPGSHTFWIPDPDHPTNSKSETVSFTGEDYLSTNTKCLFLDLQACYGSCHVLSSGTDAPYCLAESFIFAQNYGVLAIGSTTLWDWLGLEDFYDSWLSAGKSVGDAFKDWATNYADTQTCLGCACWFMTITGDPTLKKPRITFSESGADNSTQRGDIYVDNLLYAYTNSTRGIWSGNHTVKTNNFWRTNSTTNNTGYRCTFSHWEDNSTSLSRNITVLGEASYTAYFTQKYCAGDVNGDNVVDIYDAILISNALGASRGGSKWDSRCDLFHNQVIDIYDCQLVGNNYGKTY